MSLGLGLRLGLRQQRSGSSAYSGHVLALDFKNGQYWSGGTQAGSLSAMSGYAYTRTGSKQELLSSSSVYPTVFTANQPGIVPAVGYYARAAMTNYAPRSSEADDAAWSKSGSTVVTANYGTAPDGTQTADRVQTTTGSAYSARLALDGLASTGTTQRTGSLWMRSLTGGNVTVDTDLTEPAVLNHHIEVTVTPTWQRFTNTQTFSSSASGSSWGINVPASGVGFDILVWDGQVSAGADTGAVIPTAGAAATVGADDLRVGVTLADQDQLFFCKVTAPSFSLQRGLFEVSASGSANNRVMSYISGSGSGPAFYVVAGGVAIFAGNVTPGLTSGVDLVAVARRRSGNWRVGTYQSGVLTWAAAEAAGAMPTGLNRCDVGTINAAATVGPEAPISGMYIKAGTFTTDAEVIAAITAVP